MVERCVYLLCALTSVACAWLLLRGYRSSRSRLLFWSSLGFWGLALNNVLLVIDLIIVPDVDLSVARTATALVAMVVLVAGLIWEAL